MPCGKGVRGKTLMDQAERAHRFRICKLAVELCYLMGEQQPLVDDGPRRERWDIEKRSVANIRFRDLRFSALTDNVEPALKVIRLHLVGGADEYLLYVGL